MLESLYQTGFQSSVTYRRFSISAAVNEFQASAKRLTDTINLFQDYKAKSNNERFLQGFKPVSGQATAANVRCICNYKMKILNKSYRRVP